MTRSKVLIVVSGTFAFLAIVIACIIITFMRSADRRAQGLMTIDEFVDRQKIRHEAVEHARARLPQDSTLQAGWSLEQAMTAWQSDEIEKLAELARQFLRSKKDLPAYDREKLVQFAANSPELNELTEAIECGLCEITLDPAKGQWQIVRGQVKALKSMTYMLAARAVLLAEKGDNQGALKTILNSYALMDVLLDVPNVNLQARRPDMLLYIGYAINRAADPDKIPAGTKAVLLKHLERQSSAEPLVNALKLHEALVRQDVSAKHSPLKGSWLLAGYDRGMDHVMQSLDQPHNASRRSNEIVDGAPFYAGQTKWRLQNVAPDVLHARVNSQSHAESVSNFLGLRPAKR